MRNPTDIKINEPVIIPPVMYRNKKVVYFADPMLTSRCDSIEQECEDVIVKELAFEDLAFHKIHCTDEPPFGKMVYDVLFFDYGGMIGCDGLMHSFCREIIKEAQDYPNRYYVVVSTFSQYAMKDALKEFSGCLKSNIYLSIQDFARAFKRYEE